MTITYIWLLAGVALLIAEAVHIPGVGLMFAGLGAVTVSLLISGGQLAADDTLPQLIAFFIATAGWTALLWKPLQKFRVGRKQGGYSNIIGETALVAGEGITKQSGEVTWSGTVMKARLAQNAGVDQLPAGASVVVKEVTGATLIVTPQP